MEITNINQLLAACGLFDKYKDAFAKEDITLERFGKLITQNSDLMQQLLLNKIHLTIGELIDLTQAYEKYIKKSEVKSTSGGCCGGA